MRVAFVAKSLPLTGGVEAWLDDLTAGLAARGHECLVGLADGGRFHDAARYTHRHPALTWQPVASTTGSPAGRAMAVERFLRRARAAVVVPVLLRDALAVAAATRARLGHHVIYPVHEVAPGVDADLRHLGDHLGAAVAVDAAGEALIARCAPALPRHLIPGAVPRARVRAPAHREGTGLVVGYCGRLEYEAKRVGDLPPVLAALRAGGVDARLLVAGEGSRAAALGDTFAAAGLDTLVHLLGAMPRHRLYETFYPALDVLLVTSESETGPLVAFEAMAHGVPVVCADFRGRAAAGALRDGETCLVFPVGDAGAAAAAIARLAHEPALRTRIAAAGDEEVARERDPQVMADRWHRLVCGELRAAPPAPAALPGIVERLREHARRALGRRFEHEYPRAEWPPYGA